MNLGSLGNRRPVQGQRHPTRPAPPALFPTQGAELYAFRWAEYTVVRKHKCTKQS